jgi:hypothetical protein
VTLSPFVGPAVPASVGIAALGSGALVAVAESLPDGSQRVAVHPVGADGAAFAGASFPVDGQVQGAIAIVADPTRGIVAAWSELAPGAMEEVLRIGKLTCAPALDPQPRGPGTSRGSMAP